MILTAKELIRLDNEVKAAETALEELKARRDQVNNALVNKMVDAETQNITIAGRVLYLNNSTRYSAIAAKKEELFQALEDNGLADIVKPTINANTLSSTVGELVEQNGGQLPLWLSDLVSAYSKTKVNIKKGGAYNV